MTFNFLEIRHRLYYHGLSMCKDLPHGMIQELILVNIYAFDIMLLNTEFFQIVLEKWKRKIMELGDPFKGIVSPRDSQAQKEKLSIQLAKHCQKLEAVKRPKWHWGIEDFNIGKNAHGKLSVSWTKYTWQDVK